MRLGYPPRRTRSPPLASRAGVRVIRSSPNRARRHATASVHCHHGRVRRPGGDPACAVPRELDRRPAAERRGITLAFDRSAAVAERERDSDPIADAAAERSAQRRHRGVPHRCAPRRVRVRVEWGRDHDARRRRRGLGDPARGRRAAAGRAICERQDAFDRHRSQRAGATVLSRRPARLEGALFKDGTGRAFRGRVARELRQYLRNEGIET